MKYFVFAYDQYYPSGGPNDLIAIRDDITQAIKVAREALSGQNGQTRYDFVQIMNSDGLDVKF